MTETVLNLLARLLKIVKLNLEVHILFEIYLGSPCSL